MNNEVQQAIAIAIKKKSQSSSRRRLGWGFFIGIVFVVVTAVVIVIVRRRREAEIDKKQRDAINLVDIKTKNAALAEKAGIPSEVMEDALGEEIGKEKEKKKKCNVSPLLNGLCGEGYNLEKGCCYPKEARTSKRNEDLQMAKDIVTEVSISIVAGFVLERMIAMGIYAATKKGAVTAGTRAAVAGTKTARAALAGSRAARAAAAAAKAARALAAGARIAATATAKYSAAASAGPPGWIAAGLMLIFDAVSITLDILDVDGYDSYTSQGVLNKMRSIIDYSMASEFEKLEMDYPFMFPITTAYPEEMPLAQEYANSVLVEKYMKKDIELEKHKNAKIAFDAYVKKIVDNPDSEPPVPQEYTDFILQMLKDRHKERDSLIFSKLKELLGEKAYTIEYYEAISGPDRLGVSLSEEGAKEWNSQHEQTWLNNNDLYNPPDPETVEKPDPPAACYTDTYYVYDSGPSDDPVMVPKKLPVKTVLGNYYGPLLAYCEKMRQMKGTSTSVNPKALGTRFNFNSGVCEFSKEYCRRYGLQFKNNDCKPAPGQDIAEMIFGKTITRGSIREWERRKDDYRSGDPARVSAAVAQTIFDPTGLGRVTIEEAKKSYAKKSQPATVGDCPSGMRDDGVNCWLDPYKIPTGTIPNTCRASEPTRIGTRCYEPCPVDYEPNEAVPTLCEPKCGGSRPLKRGTICYEDCRELEGGQGGWFNGSLLECAACNRGWSRSKIPGFCEKPGGFKAWPYRQGRSQKPIGLPKQRKSHSAKCPEGKEERDGLCYEPCKNKGPEGQYKYNGVLDWCQPEGGAGIKKGLDDRMKCPEGWERKGPLCYEPCKEGERDDGLFCKKAG